MCDLKTRIVEMLAKYGPMTIRDIQKADVLLYIYWNDVGLWTMPKQQLASLMNDLVNEGKIIQKDNRYFQIPS